MNLEDFFYNNLIGNELAQSRKEGCYVYCSNMMFGNLLIENKSIETLTKSKFTIPKMLVGAFSNHPKFHMEWAILDEIDDDRGTMNQFKTNDWIKENYLDVGYSFDLVKDYLTGSVFLPTAEEFIGLNRAGEEGYEVVGNHLNLNTANWHPIDFHIRYTAFLKSDNKEIIDNVWLIDLDGQKVYDMKVSIEQYFELGYKAKLLYGWQSVYVLKKKSEHYEFMKRFLPKIIPHLTLDLTEFGI